MLGAYLSVLLAHRVKSRLGAVFLSAVPLGMLTLAIVLCIQEWTGSLQAAGSVSGLFGLGNAVGLGLQGWLMDRAGSRAVVVAAGSVCTAALIGFALAGTLGGSLWLVAVLAGIAGVSIPAITTAVRAWLRFTFSDESLRSTSYALLTALFRGAVAIGPLLVSLALIMYGPTLAVGMAAVMIMAATLVYVLTGDQQRHHRVSQPDAPRESPLVSAGLRTLLVAAALEGLAVGVTAVAIPGVMSAAGVAVLAGLGFAALALGQVLGALVFGSRPWPGPRWLRLPVIQAIAALVAGLIYLVSQQPWLLVVVMLAAGFTMAPISVLKSALLDDVAPNKALARSYSMLVASGLVSAAAGNALAGNLAELTGVNGLLLLPVITLGLASAWTTSRHHTLKPDTGSTNA